MPHISKYQAGLRSAQQLDQQGILRHLMDVFGDKPGPGTEVMLQDVLCLSGSRQGKLKRDLKVN